MKSTLLLAAALAAAAARNAAPAEGPSPFRLVSMTLAVDLDYPNEKLSGTAVLEIENASAVPASDVPLLLGRLMRFDAIATPEGDPLPAETAVVVFSDSPKQQVRSALVHLRQPVSPGGRASIRAAWSGYLVGYTETGSLYIRDRIDPEFTILRADAYAFPVVGVPSWRANRGAPGGDFAFDVTVTAPRELTVANGGELLERRETGDRVAWRYRSPAAPFLNVAIARYDVGDEDGIRLYAFPWNSTGAERVRASAARAIELYARWFGPTARPARFAIIEIPEDWGSQASLSGGIIQTESAFVRPEAMIELYHELSHFWNVPDTDAPSPRWNEGLAMYLQQRAAADLDGGDLDAVLSAATNRLRGRLDDEPRLATVPMAAYGSERMTDWSYSVGRLMFALLEKTAGSVEFSRLLRDFYQQYKISGAGTREFAAWLGDRGGAPVRALLADWLTSTAWVAKLRSGRPLDAIAAEYRATR
jgi:hypothetical protein